MSKIEVSGLPKSFRDAVSVCLHLGIPYLWIDSLCIVQDDEYGFLPHMGTHGLLLSSMEWLAEAEKMADIFQMSHLTIAASRARNSYHGFLFDFPDDTVHYEIVAEAQWERSLSGPLTFCITCRIDDEYLCYTSTPLDRRAWCLQNGICLKSSLNFVRTISDSCT